MTEITITSKDFYRMRKAAHVCVTCGREDAYTIAGRSRCCECQEQVRQRQKQHYPEHRETKNEAARRRYRDRIAAGLCGICGKRLLADSSSCYCEQCRAKNRLKLQKRRRDHGVLANDEYFELGLCFKCGKTPHLGGQKLCARCSASLARARANNDPAKNGIAFRRENDAFWATKRGGKYVSQSNTAAG